MCCLKQLNSLPFNLTDHAVTELLNAMAVMQERLMRLEADQYESRRKMNEIIGVLRFHGRVRVIFTSNLTFVRLSVCTYIHIRITLYFYLLAAQLPEWN